MPDSARLILWAGVAAALAGALWTVDRLGYERGHAKARAAAEAAGKAAAQAQATRILELQEQARQAEQRSAEAAARASAGYQRRLNDANAETERLAALLRGGDLRLRLPAFDPAERARSAPAPPAAAAGGCDGSARAELPGPIAEALLRLAAEADSVVEQLTACQAVIRADRGQ